jgi:hypothetical protein
MRGRHARGPRPVSREWMWAAERATWTLDGVLLAVVAFAAPTAYTVIR